MLFITDHIFLRYNNNIYSSKFSYEIFNRYLKVFEQMTIVSRIKDVKDVNDIDGALLSSGAGINFEFMQNISSLKSFLGPRKNVRIKIEKILDQHDFLIIRIPSQLGFLAASIAENKNIKYGLEVVGCGWEAFWYYGSLTAKLYSFYTYFKMKSVVKNSCYSLYVTEQFLQDRYRPNPKAKVTCVSNVELLHFDEDLIKHRIQKIKKKSGTIIFGTIGSLKTNYKGIHIAIKALSKCDFDFEYRVLGDGIYLEEYKRLSKELNIEDKINFQGILGEREQIFNWFDDVDIYLQPSLTEGLPRALIEAMSRGCPSIGSDSGGIPELLNQKVIFKTKDYEGLRKIINELVFNIPALESYAIENFKNAKKYKNDILDSRRTKFWTNFRDSLKLKNK